MGARVQHSPSYRRLCGLLRKWRTDAGLTQRALAKRLRKPPSFVHKTEIGDRRMDPVEFVAWCRACKKIPSESIADLER
jgi:predicted transcriptional regulator